MNEYFPAVFFAGGHGMGTTDPVKIPGLEDFLLRRTDHFDVSNIPDNLTVSPLSTPFELTLLYHLYAVGWCWRIFGVSVFSLVLFGAFLCALSTCAVYGIFRLGTCRPVSLIGALLFASSPAILCISNNWRNFGKTPFMLIALWLLLRLIMRPVSRLSMLIASVVLGLTLGMGMGFRQDVLIAVPPAIVVIAFFVHVKGRHHKKVRAASILLFLSLFGILSRPIFQGATLEGNQASVHSFFQGLSPDVEALLDFGGASYEGLYWTDSGLYGQANVLARRLGNTTPMVNPHTAEFRRAHGDRNGPRLINWGLYYTGIEYSHYARILAWEVIRQFPADLVNRAWCAVAALYKMPSDMCKNIIGVQATFPEWLYVIFKFHNLLASIIGYAGLSLVAIMLLAISSKNFKSALGVTFLLIWFTGYPSIFFEYRHIAYLVFIPIGTFLIWLEWIGRGLLFLKSHPLRENLPDDYSSLAARVAEPIHNSLPSDPKDFSLKTPENKGYWYYLKPISKMSLLALVVFLAVTAPLVVLRWWQTNQVYALADQLQAAPRAAVDVQVTVDQERIFVASTAPLPGLATANSLPPGETAWEYLAVVFDTKGQDIPVTLEYDHDRVLNDSTQTVTLYGDNERNKETVTFFFPVYEANTLYSPDLFKEFLEEVDLWQWRQKMDPARPFEEQDIWKRGKFLGISFPASAQNAFLGLYRVRPQDGLIYLPIFQVPENRSSLRTHKSFLGMKKSDAS